MQEATGWLELGQPGKAVLVFGRELAGVPAADQVDAGVFRARLARACALDGRADCAARAALGAWEIAGATGSRRAVAELARVRRIVGGAAESAAAARFTAVFDAQAGQAGLLTGERAVR